MARDPGSIARMFGRIASRYDLMNGLMTFGLDTGWRRLAAAQARPALGEAILDACCGTGDLSFALQDLYPESNVIGVDFTPEMVRRAQRKVARRDSSVAPLPRFLQGDLLGLPFADGTFGAATVAWGVRNVGDAGGAFREMARVTRPGGRVVCLESTPTGGGPGTPIRDAWMRWAVPALGRFVAGDPDAYRYLPASVQGFSTASELAGIMAAAGLVRIRYRSLTLGAVSLHVGEVPAGNEVTSQ